MDWDFFFVMMTLSGSATVLMLAGAVAKRIAQGSQKKEIEAGDPMDPLAQERLLASLTNVEERMASLEERFDFNERLLQGRAEKQVEPHEVDPEG